MHLKQFINNTCPIFPPISMSNFCILDCGEVQAIEAATLHPAQMLGITDRKGTLGYNTDADFIILDNALNLQATYIAGEKVWDSCTLPGLDKL